MENGVTEITEARNFEAIKVSDASAQLLAFLPDEERQKIPLSAQQSQCLLQMWSSIILV